MKVRNLIKKLMAMPQDAEIVVHCNSATTKIKGVKEIHRPPRCRGYYEILDSLGHKDSSKCVDEKMKDQVFKIQDEELKVRDDWYEQNKKVAEPCCDDDYSIFELDSKIEKAICIVGADFD